MSCDGCHAPCCRAPFYVRLTPEEAARLKIEGPLLPEAGRCRFLTNDHRCAIYESRPIECCEYEVGGSHCPPERKGLA